MTLDDFWHFPPMTWGLVIVWIDLWFISDHLAKNISSIHQLRLCTPWTMSLSSIKTGVWWGGEQKECSKPLHPMLQSHVSRKVSFGNMVVIWCKNEDFNMQQNTHHTLALPIGLIEISTTHPVSWWAIIHKVLHTVKFIWWWKVDLSLFVYPLYNELWSI